VHKPGGVAQSGRPRIVRASSRHARRYGAVQDSQGDAGTMDDQPVVRVKVWDGWVRLVHWSVVVLLGVSWASMELGKATPRN
jgi:hypothetical protein